MEYRSREIVMSPDLNGAGTLFGGKAFSFIDKESYVHAACELDYNKLVTVFVSEMTFVSPAREGDIIEIGADVISIGRTSITLKAAIRNKTTREMICEVEKIVFVAIDDNGKPMAHGKK